MRSAKMLTITGALAATAMTLAACSAPAPAEPEGPVDLRMTVWTSNEDHLALFDSIAEAYMAENENVASVTFDPLPFDDYTTTITTQIAGGNAPDLAWVLENAALDFVGSGALLDLAPSFEAAEGFEYDDLSDAATGLWRQGDGLYAYPFSTSPFAIFSNTTLLAESNLPSAGEQVAAGDWNWDAVAANGAAVNAATGKAGFIVRDFEYQQWDLLSTVWNGWGAQPWNDDRTECTIDSDEMVDAFEFLHEAAFETGAMPGPGTTADFFAGEAAYTVTQISRAGLLAEAGFDWELNPLPEGPAGKYSVVGQAGIGVIADSPNAQVAADFLAFFTNPENSRQLAQYFPPPRESLLTGETLAKTNPLLSAEQLDSVVIEGIATGVTRPSIEGSAEIQQAVRSELDALWTPDADIPAVLSATCDAMQPLIQG